MTSDEILRILENAKDKNGQIPMSLVRKAFSKLPPAQPQRMHGRWIPVTNGRGGHECDQCHEYAPSYQSGNEYLSNYCPHCGADMREENNDKS